MKRAALCAMTLNEGPYIQEWIAYHTLIGFDSVIVYDTGSTDGTARLAERMRSVADVTVIDWSGVTAPDAQHLCFLDCCKRFAGEYEWIAFLDVDEFLATAPRSHLSALLAGKVFVSGIVLNWACFGSNGHQQTPAALTIAAFTRRSDENFPPNAHTKTLVRPERVRGIENTHYLHLDGYYNRANGHSVAWQRQGLTQTPVLSGWKVNHYFVRSRQQWAEKLARGYRDGTVRAAGHFETYDRNEVEDLSAAALADEVAARIRRAEGQS